MFQRAQQGDSPTIIARRFGVSRDALISANPWKPTTTVAGQRTWRGLHRNEIVRIPGKTGVGALGDIGLGAVTPADPNAPHALIKQGSSGADVALWQTILGVTVDGSFGPNTAAATRAWQSAHGLGADGIVGPKTWTAALGGPYEGTGPATPAPTVAPRSVPAAVQALLSFDPCDPANVTLVCQAQSALGIGADGKYGADTAGAARRLLPNAPAGCSPRPSWWKPAGQSNCHGATPSPAPAPQQPTGQVTPAPAPGGGGGPAQPAAMAMASALAAHGYKRADQALYAAFQRAAGLTADGYPGAGTMNALNSVLTASGIQTPNVKVYPWRSTGAYDGVNAPTQSEWTGAAAPAADQAKAAATIATQAATDAAAKAAQATTQAQANQAAAAAQAAANTAAAATQAAAQAAAQATTQAQADAAAAAAKTAAAATTAAAQATQAAAAQGGTVPGGGGTQLTPPDQKKGVSTGAIVAGAVGVAALVGLIGLAVSKPGAHGSRGKTGPRGRKAAKRKPSGTKRKSAKRKKK